MATGYTCNVQDGSVTELKDYMLNCARHFGALIHMREDDSPEIKYREASDYHLKALNKAHEKLEQLKKMTDEEIQNEIDNNYENAIKSMNELLNKRKEYKDRYLNMIDKVNEWEPPTDEHLGLKEFAIEQLQNSLSWDCDNTYIHRKIEKETVAEYRAEYFKHYSKEIEYHSNSYQEEIKRTEEANKWIRDLINSFN